MMKKRYWEELLHSCRSHCTRAGWTTYSADKRHYELLSAIDALHNVVQALLHHMPEESPVIAPGAVTPDKLTPGGPCTSSETGCRIPEVKNREFIFRGRRYVIPDGSTAKDYLVCVGERAWQERKKHQMTASDRDKTWWQHLEDQWPGLKE